jgi:hypothetical protein
MSELGIQKTEKVATYMRSLFSAELKGKSDEVVMPKWSLDFLEDCNWAVKVMVAAWRKRSESKLPWTTRNL